MRQGSVGLMGEAGPLVYLAGGLGNQIFMLAAGWAVAKRFQSPLFVDCSFYEAKGFRKPEIMQLPTGAIDVSSVSPLGSQRLPNGRVVPYPRSIDLLKRPVVFDFLGPEVVSCLTKKSSKRTMVGYFQSFDFFREVAQDIISWFEIPVLGGAWSDLTGQEKSSGFVCIHIRRGDLVGGRKTSKNLVPMSYFAKAINQLPDDLKNMPLVVFTDSKDFVQREWESHDVLRTYPFEFFDDSDLGSPAVLRAMSQAQSFILSFSTFSFWAYWLAVNQRGKKISAFAPEASRRLWSEAKSGVEPVFL